MAILSTPLFIISLISIKEDIFQNEFEPKKAFRELLFNYVPFNCENEKNKDNTNILLTYKIRIKTIALILTIIINSNREKSQKELVQQIL